MFIVLCTDKFTVNSQMKAFAALLFLTVNYFALSLQAAVCDPPPNIENGDYSCDRKLKLGSVCKYHCSSGYLLRPSNHTGLLCYKNSVWVGSRLPVCLLDHCPEFPVIDLVVAMDASQSIEFENWQDMKSFVDFIISSYYFGPEGMRIGVFQFRDHVITSTQILLNRFTDNDKQKFLNATKYIRYNKAVQGSDISNALTYARTVLFTRANGDRPTVRNVLLVITDGQVHEAFDRQQIPIIANDLRRDGVLVLAIGIFPPYGAINERVLIDIAQKEENLLYPSSGLDTLQKQFSGKITDFLCPYYGF